MFFNFRQPKFCGAFVVSKAANFAVSESASADSAYALNDVGEASCALPFGRSKAGRFAYAALPYAAYTAAAVFTGEV